ncbi:hypothetical protein DFH07DRAFT_779284 [Mycena maculata]|uniref:Uncharacterized protein n=1 Tax=Mycena maculata TaxID=230809 RepID=A0AAD7IA89_9AGAR|nr:hypothetical protein DFH07DRAFT_779284 [Mycena maculata]
MCCLQSVYWHIVGTSRVRVMFKITPRRSSDSGLSQVMVKDERVQICKLATKDLLPTGTRFPEGCDFHQWTGDDSKALMKIYLGAVAGYLPSDMMKALSALMKFCYIVRRNAISAPDLITIKNALNRFHQYRQAFIDISLPRQHSLIHYIRSTRLFVSLNGLCSSTTESKHIKVVKEPWQHSSRYKALPQMLVMLTCLDKLATACCDFTVRGMMTSTVLSYMAMVLVGLQPQVEAVDTTALAAEKDDKEDDDSVMHGPRSLSDIELAPTPHMSHLLLSKRGYPKYLVALAAHVGHLTLPLLLRQFLYAELHSPPAGDAALPLLHAFPIFDAPITAHHSVIACFYALSYLCSTGGMSRKHIQPNLHWHGYACHDTVLVNAGGLVMGGIVAARALLLFSFTFQEQH